MSASFPTPQRSPATVCIMDSHHQELSPEQYDLLDLQVEHNQDSVRFAPVAGNTTPNAKLGCVGRQFVVKGVKIGGAVATFSVSKSSGRLYSEPLNIQVFPPLQIEPAELVLVPGLPNPGAVGIVLTHRPGAQFQVECFGWPSGDAVLLTFQTADASVVVVNSDGLLTAQAVGSTSVAVQAQARVSDSLMTMT